MKQDNKTILRDRIFLKLLKDAGVPEPVREFRFHPKRQWRADFAWPEQMILLEVEGGVWIQGRHNSAPGFMKDIEKYNQAALLGYRLLRFPPEQLHSPDTIKLIKQAVNSEIKENKLF